jgi:hypothetical protein
MAYLKIQTSNSSYSFLVTNAAPAKPYLKIVSDAATSFLPLVTNTSTHAGMKMQVVSGASSYRNMFQDNKSSGTTWNTTSNATNSKMSSLTYLTKATTTGTKYATGTSTTLTKYATGTSTTATKYATGTSTTATKYATGTSTTGTSFATGTVTTGTKYASRTTTTGTKYATGTSTTKTVYATTSKQSTFSVPSLKSINLAAYYSATTMKGISLTDAAYGTVIRMSTFGSRLIAATNQNVQAAVASSAIKNNSAILCQIGNVSDAFTLVEFGQRQSWTSINNVVSSNSWSSLYDAYWNDGRVSSITVKTLNNEFPWSTNAVTYNQTITYTSGNTKSTYVSFRMVNHTTGGTYTASEYYPNQERKKYTLTQVSLASVSATFRATTESASSSKSYATTTNTLYSTKTVTSTPITYQTTTRTTTPLTYQTTTKTSTPVTYLTKTVTSTPVSYSTKTVTSTPISYSTKTVTSTPITYSTKTVTSTPITYQTTKATTGYSGKVSSGSSWTEWG